MAFGTPIGSKGRAASSATQATGAVDTRGCNTFFVGVGWEGAATFTSLVDSVGNTYTIVGAEVDPSGTGHARLYRCVNGVGSATHTATLTISSAQSIEVLFVAVSGGGAFDSGSGVADTATPFVSPNLTTIFAREMLVAFTIGNSGSNPATHAESTGFTIVSAAEETDGSLFFAGAMATRAVTTVGTYNASFTVSGSTREAVFIASFLEAPDAGARRILLNLKKGPRVQRFRPVQRAYTNAAATAAITGAVGVDINVAGTLTGTGALTGAIGIVINPVGALSGSGALAGAININIAPTSTLSGIGAMTGAVGVSINPVGSLTGTGALVGAIPISINPVGVMTGTGNMTGAIPLAITPTATLTGTGALTGAVSVSFNVAGTLADAPGGGAISGAVGINFTVIGALTGTGDLAGSVAISFSPVGVLTNASAPIDVATQKPAGAIMRRRKRRLEVEIDGQVFPVESVEQAAALLDRARELAATSAAATAEAVVAQKLADKPPVNKPIRVPVPQIHTDDQELVEIVVRARHAIARIYREQALAAEIRLRMEWQMREDDEDDVELLLL